MSSRIIRGAGACAAEPLSPRSTDGALASNKGLQGARQAAVPDEDAGLQARLQAALEQGRQEGQASAARHALQKATQEAQEKLEPVLDLLRRTAESLVSQGPRLRAESEQDMVRLAIAIAHRVLHRELATDPEAILGVVKAAFARLNARETQCLRLSPQDAGTVTQYQSLLCFPPGLEIVPDGSLTAGSVIFETSRGELEASVDTHLAEIGRGLADILRRRQT